MRKYLFLAAAACVALAACNKEQSSRVEIPAQQQELTFMQFMGRQTKGYVTNTAFADVAGTSLHKPETNGDVTVAPRTMRISSYLTPQAGIPGTYFKDYTYKRDASDALWHNYIADTKTPIYWPIGGVLDFLAFSTTEDITASWDEQNVAQKVVLDVTDDFRQDDIVFSSVSSKTVGTGGATGKNGTVEMTFKHAQAWIQFQLTSDQEDIITIEKIELEDVYGKGELTVTNNNGDALAVWSFRDQTRSDLEMDDNNTVLGSPLKVKDADKYGLVGDTVGYMDMLIPEQPKTSFLITYKLAGQSNVLTYRYDLAHENWLMGYRYIYDIMFSVNEITVNPVVVAWDEGNVTDLSPVNPS